MVVCITGPVLGIIIGGAIVQKFAGGYEGKHASTISLIYALLAFISSLPIKIISNLYVFGVCLWSVLFFGGACIPNIQGIMISSLDTDLRAAGTSIASIIQNIFGYLPSPVIYGFIYNYSKASDKKLAMALTLWYSIVGVIFLSFSLYYRFKKIKIEQNMALELSMSNNLSDKKENSLNNENNLQKLNKEKSLENLEYNENNNFDNKVNNYDLGCVRGYSSTDRENGHRKEFIKSSTEQSENVR